MLSTDVGSVPLNGELDRLGVGANYYESLLPLLYGPGSPPHIAAQYFEDQIVAGVAKKLSAGISVPAYPQLRDMNEMFLRRIDGIRREEHGWVATDALRITPDKLKIPEVYAVLRNGSKIQDLKRGPLQLRVCLTGPYTLASFFAKRSADLLGSFGDILSRVAAANTSSTKHVKIRILSIDEPVLGFLSDSLLDQGSQGREVLISAWENICREAKARGVEPLIHLHNTSLDLFWEVESLTHIESHVDDPLYRSKQARKQCEVADKFIKASIAVTDFESLIRQKIGATSKRAGLDTAELVAETWNKIRKKSVNPVRFLETQTAMEKRLRAVVRLFGKERVRLAGPECGLGSFPTSDCAIECLRRTAVVARAFGRRSIN